MIFPSESRMIFVGLAMAFSGLPQAFRIFLRRSSDVSLSMFLILLVGQGCWVWYGLSHRSPSLVVMNAAAAAINAAIITLAIRFRRK